MIELSLLTGTFKPASFLLPNLCSIALRQNDACYESSSFSCIKLGETVFANQSTASDRHSRLLILGRS
jgi:hypothetical protein